MLFLSVLICMGLYSQKKQMIDLTGKWINEESEILDSTSIGLVEITFHTDKKVLVKLNPGNEFLYSYELKKKSDYFVIRFVKDQNTENRLPILLLKPINLNKAKVQVLDFDDKIRWETDESGFNTGILKRVIL